MSIIEINGKSRKKRNNNTSYLIYGKNRDVQNVVRRRFKYKYIVDDIMEHLPKDIMIYNDHPIGESVQDKKYLSMCYNLDPKFNLVSVRTEDSFTSVIGQKQLEIYLGGVCTVTANTFLKKAMKKNVLIKIYLDGESCFYMINPYFAINKNNKKPDFLYEFFSILMQKSYIFGVESVFNGDIEGSQTKIIQNYIKKSDIFKPKKNNDMEI